MRGNKKVERKKEKEEKQILMSALLNDRPHLPAMFSQYIHPE